MKITTTLCLVMVCLLSCNTNEHQGSTHNFTVQRLIILNDKNEILMSREESVWATPSLVYNKRQFLKEGLDSLSNAYGIKVTDLELRGQFSYKYDYHPYATLRNYFVARYVSGELTVPNGLAEAKWIPVDQAIEKNTVTSIKEITKQIMEFPNVVWGGSFMVSHVGDEHPTKMVESFYPLLEYKADK
ncbi:NUDIX hydrolase [uncultured Aquimarina sp.]|uniref:NUDIX hydrolase n=1 Tax=uncultured Aquimarina sp. TaxID=575652 RepID=UPI0026291B9D|nr:NUDIX hydrolase [uncultured Aquimarina sp.]